MINEYSIACVQMEKYMDKKSGSNMLKLLFKRGYLISNKAVDKFLININPFLATEWKKFSIGSYCFYHDPLIYTYKVEKRELSIVLLGTVIDPINFIDDPYKIIKLMYEKYMKSEEDFFNYLDVLSGRFILFLNSFNKTFILQDATGNRSLFYHELDDELLISSHIQLIAEIRGYTVPLPRMDFAQSSDYRANCRYFPGNLTIYEKIYTLTPNTLIDLNNRIVKRFFPREKLVPQKITRDLIEELGDLFTKQIKLLSRNKNLTLSLTGGIDSRLSLAASKPAKDKILYFTYIYNNHRVPLYDAERASQICKLLSLNHLIIKIETEIDDEYKNLFYRNSANMRALKQGITAKALTEKLPPDSLEIKSNVSEIGRAFYQKNHLPMLPIKKMIPAILSKCYKINAASQFTRNAFIDFVKLTSFTNIAKYNYGYHDMFYWEHRIGCWQSLQIQDFDISHETFILFNNRHILKKFLSVNIQERLESKLYFALIEFLWPEVLKFEIYPASWLAKTKRQKLCKRVWSLLK